MIYEIPRSLSVLPLAIICCSAGLSAECANAFCSRSGTDFSSTIGQSVPIRTWSAPRMSTAARITAGFRPHRVDIDVTAGEGGRVASDALAVAEAASQQQAPKGERRHNQLQFRDLVERAALRAC